MARPKVKPKKRARGKALVRKSPSIAQVMDTGGGWWPMVREPFTGAWQRNQEWTVDTVAAYHAVYACITLIASDIGKLRPKLVQLDADGIWSETSSPAFSPVLAKPNRYQTHIQFKEWWAISKLIRGNAYALKERDQRGVVVALYLLDPSRVKVLVAPDGGVFYELSQDHLSGLDLSSLTVPASEILHDRMNCLFHPLVGISPIFASGLAASVGLKIEQSSQRFFGKGAQPSGVITSPTNIPQADADRLEQHWNANFAGDHAGAVAVLPNGLKFEPMRMTAVDAQVIEQLKWTAETVCSAFHVPAFKVGIGVNPTYQNIETLNQIYYSDCLQSHIESFEAVMDDGLGLDSPKDGKQMGVELDLDGLLRMDSKTQMETQAVGVGGGFLAPDEARRALNLKPVKGGATPYLQQQNYSLAALDERDRAAPAPGSTGDRRQPAPTPAPPPAPPAPTKDLDLTEIALRVASGLRRAA